MVKPIELTKEQKSKLLEICKALFPSYYKIEINSFLTFYKTEGDYFLATEPMCKYPKDIFKIHWFEFCIKQLIPKLFDNEMTGFSDNTNLEIAYMKLFDNNPVDFLYQQFLKLK